MKKLSLDFRFLEKLGQGAEGSVYRVAHQSSQRLYAAKTYSSRATPVSPIDLPRHPCLLPVLARRRTIDGMDCNVMPLLHPIDPRMAAETGGPDSALDLLAQAAAGLSCLHRGGFVHGDLKPGNLIAELRGDCESSAPFLVVSDLDIASHLTSKPRGISGTLGYIAPEVLDGQPVSPTSDVYSLGAWFHWLITGNQTVPGTDLSTAIVDTRRLVERAKPWRADERFAGLFWEELLARLLSPKPDQRFEDATELLRHISAHADLVSEKFASRLPKIAWNPLVLTEGEMSSVKEMTRRLADSDQPEAILLRTTREGGASLLLQEVSRRLSILDEEICEIRAASPHAEIMRRLTQSDLGLVIINDAESGTQFEAHRLIEILDLCRQTLSEPRRWRTPLILIQSPRSAANSIVHEAGQCGLSICSVVEECVPTISWLDSLFSGLRVSESVREALDSTGVVDPASLREAFSSAIQSSSLRSSVTGILLDGRRGRTWLDEFRRFRDVQLASLDSPDQALWHLMNRLPSGLSPWLCNSIREKWAPFSRALARLRGQGFVREREAGFLDLTSPVFAGDTAAGQQLPLDLINALRLIARGAEPVRQVPALLRIELNLIASPEDGRVQRRAVAYARWLLARRRPVDVLRLLASADHVHPGEGHRSLAARMLQLRARALNSIGYFRQAVDCQVRAADAWHDLGKVRLAAECATCASSWQQSFDSPEQVCRYIELSRGRLQSAGAESSSRLCRRFDAVSLFPLLRLNGTQEVSALCQSILDDPKSDGFSRSEALRVLSFVAGQNGHRNEERDRLADSLREARRCRHPESCARTLTSTANRELARGQTRKAHYLLKWVDRLDPGRIRPTDALSKLSGQGGIAFEYGDMRRALYFNQEALAVGERIGNPAMVNSAHRNLSLILLRMNRPGPALEHLRVILESDSPVRIQHSHPAYGAAVVLLEIGAYQEAREFLARAAAAPEWQGSDLRRGQLLVAKSVIAAFQHEPDDSRRYSDEALACFVRGGAVDEQVKERLRRLGAFAELTTSTDEIDSELRWAEDAASRLKTWLITASCRLARATHCKGLPTWKRLQVLEELEADLISHGEGLLELPTLQLRAEILIGEGRFEEARDVLRRAIERIRRAAGELTPDLRICYLRDARRQRFLDLIRACRPA